MADTSSDEDLPLAQRPVGGILLAGGRPIAADNSNSESTFPSWLQTGGQKLNQIVTLTDSDSDDAVLSPPKLPPAAPGGEAAAAKPQPAGNRDVQQPATQQTAEKKKPGAATPRGAAKPKATPRGRTAAAAVPADGEPASQPPATQPPATQPGGTQPGGTQPPASQAGGTATKRAPAPAVGLAAASTSQMPLLLPDKLPQMKMLVELESADDAHGVTDLSGDSGAIGRLVVTGGGKEGAQMQLDLKGVLYNATIVRCPTSVAVVNMGQAEAKVETLFSEFVQLREDTRFSFVDADLLGGLGDDDGDDHYAGGGDEEGDSGGAKKARGKAAAGGKAKPAPRKRAAPKAKGGVKKGAGRAKPKPKPKPKKK